MMHNIDISKKKYDEIERNVWRMFKEIDEQI
jgi:hypothetical protein